MKTIEISGKLLYLKKRCNKTPPKAYKILKKLGNNVTENVKINNIPHRTWLNCSHNLWSQADELCNTQTSLYKNNEAITLNELNSSSYKTEY
jgi:hypothetical protein